MKVHSHRVSSERNGRAPLPLGLLAAMRAAVVVVMLAAVLAPSATFASRGSSSGSHRNGSHVTTRHKSRARRSLKAKHDFKHAHPCPSTGKASGPCPGYVIDHVKPLCAGGADAPGNMQWQTRADSKAKDKLERQECSAFPKR